MKKFKLASCILGVICGMSAATAYADRTTYFNNNSSYDLRIWTMTCYVGMDGKQTCDDEQYAGLVKAGTTHSIVTPSKTEKTVNWQQAGVHVTHAALDARVAAGDPKGALTHMTLCDDIRDDNVNGRITFDIAANKVNCAGSLVS